MVATSRTDAPPDAGSSDVGQLVRNYLTSKGLDYSPDNVRRAIEANARDSTVLGPDPIQGLRNADAGSDPGVGQGGNVAASVTRSREPPLPTPPIPPVGASPTGASDASAPGLDVGNIGQLIAAVAPALALGAGGATLWGLNRGGAGVPTPGGAVPPPPDVGAPQIPAGDQYRLLPPPEAATPMESAMRKAIAPPGQPQLGAPPPQLPPPESQVRPPGEPPLPIAPQPPGQPRVSVEELPNYRTRPRMQLSIPRLPIR